MRLRRSNPGDAGISRRRRGSGFSYLDAEGNVITDRGVVAAAYPGGAACLAGRLDLPPPGRP
jgi:hypothetical protein